MFGLFGYWLNKHEFEPAPLVLAFVLGPLMEENLRRAMLIARGDATVFFTRPISAGLLSISILMLVLALLPMIRKRRDEVFVESKRGLWVFAIMRLPPRWRPPGSRVACRKR